MDIVLFIIGALLMLLGLAGSFLPVLPGIPISWMGLLVLHLIPEIPVNYWFLGITFGITTIIYILDIIIPALGTKKFGGSRAGMIGATLGLIAGLISPIPFGIIIGAFLGAFIGEIINKTDSKSALRAAFGSFIGLLASNFMEFMVAFAFLLLFVFKTWEYRSAIFQAL